MAMDSPRLKQIEELYHAVAGMPAANRREYFRAEGVEDEVLCNEIESLLSFDEVSNSFIDTTPDEIAAEMFSDQERSSPLIGQTIGHYTITRLLDVGGMGEVYLADDDLLNRKVALKLVWPGLVMQGDQLKRFKREAQASSALNHPNILTIHEFGTEDGTNYIVSEFVDGITLRKRMTDGGLSLKVALDIAVQVASALVAAHEAGIVHRDIKPENIMIRRDGIVKLLDFGIAKLMMPDSQDRSFGDEAQTLFKTAPGIVMGTANYMSPEQARGVDVDGRTDVWSLGIVIYEMCSGHVPFGGDTQTDVLVEILSKPIPAFADTPIAIPDGLARIIDRTLAKNTDERYQTAEALYSDLKTFRNRLDFEAQIAQTPGQATSELSGIQAEAAAKVIPTGGHPPSTRPNPVYTTNPGAETGRTGRFLLPAVITLIALTGMIGGYVWTTRNTGSGAQLAVLPAPPKVPVDVDTSSGRALAYSLTVQSYSDGRYKIPFTLSGEMLFRNRDRIRLNIKSPQSGHLYILNQGPKSENGEPAYNILFPSPTTNAGSAQLSAGQEIQIPRQSWFELDAKEGTEFVWLVWSANALPELESAKRFANPEDKGRINDKELSKRIELMLQQHQSTKAAVARDDDKKESQITGNADTVTHLIKLEHH